MSLMPCQKAFISSNELDESWVHSSPFEDEQMCLCKCDVANVRAIFPYRYIEHNMADYPINQACKEHCKLLKDYLTE